MKKPAGMIPLAQIGRSEMVENIDLLLLSLVIVTTKVRVIVKRGRGPGRSVRWSVHPR
jgi:hypothetical protein